MQTYCLDCDMFYTQIETKHPLCLMCAKCLLSSHRTLQKVVSQVLKPGHGCFTEHSWNAYLFFFGEAALCLVLGFTDSGCDCVLADSEFDLLFNLAANICCCKVTAVGIR